MAGDLPTESPTPPDVDSLPPTEYLALETLAARHRLGERTWTFPAQPRIVAAVHALARRGLVDVKSGTAPKTILAWLTEAGRAVALRDDYEPPILRMIEASSLGTPEAKALRDSVSDEVAKKIVARSKELAGRGDLPEGQQSKELTEALPHPPLNKSLRDLIADEVAEFMHQEGATQRPNDFADRVMSLLGGLAGESVCTGRVCLLDEQPWNRWR